MIAGFVGRQIDAAHEKYDQTRAVWNGAVDRRPLLIAECTCIPDIQAALAHARRSGLPIAVRGGGHSLPGHSTRDGAVVIDLRRMNEVLVDPDARTVAVGPGARWGDVDRAASRHGLATAGGDTSTVGVAGLTLGGGVGWLTRMYGLACDNLLAADVVTADGELVHASSDSHPELFWALRGGGGNFGIVTTFHLRLHPIAPALLAGVLTYSADDGSDVLQQLANLSADLRDEVSWTASFTTAVVSAPERGRGRAILDVRLCYVGPVDRRAISALEPLRRIGRPLLDTVTSMPYVELQRLTDTNAPAGARYASASEWLRHLDRSVVGRVAISAGRAPSPMSLALITQMGGAPSRRRPDETAFGFRHAPFLLTIVAGWHSAEPEEAARNRAWVHDVWHSAFGASAGGGYVNLLGDEGDARVRDAYGPQIYTRLVAVKDRYDPANVFSSNQNVRPSGMSAGAAS